MGSSGPILDLIKVWLMDAGDHNVYEEFALFLSNTSIW